MDGAGIIMDEDTINGVLNKCILGLRNITADGWIAYGSIFGTCNFFMLTFDGVVHFVSL